jgi:hypothetical protein
LHIRTSSIYGFWLLLWYILVTILSVCRLFAPSDYPFDIFWSLYSPTSSIYGFWLLLWHILVIVLSVLRILAASDYHFGILWSLYCPHSVYLRLLITPLVYFVIVLCVLRLFMAFDYSIGIFWSLRCLYFVYWRLLITPLVYFGHCIVRASAIYGFWLLLWYILVIVWSLHCLFTATDDFFGILWLLYCQYVVYLRLLITPLVFFVHCIVRTSSIYDFWLLFWYILVIVLSLRRLFTASDYSFGIFWLLYFRTSSIYGFWLLLWYILVIILSVLRLFTASRYFFGIFWSLYCLYFVYLLLMITSLLYLSHCIVCTSSIYAYDYFIGIFWSFYCPYFVSLRLPITSLVYCGHCIVCTSSIYGFWLLLWYILVIVLSVLPLFTASDYTFGIFWSLYCPYFLYLRLLITPLVSFGHCIVGTSSIYGFWLLLWYILVIVLSVLPLFTASDYSFGIFWSLFCPYFVYLRLLITSLVYFVIVLSVRRLFTAYDYFFVIF